MWTDRDAGQQKSADAFCHLYMYNAVKNLRAMARRIFTLLADSNSASNLYPALLHFPFSGQEKVHFKVTIPPICTPSI